MGEKPPPQNQQTTARNSSFCPITEILLGFQVFVNRHESQCSNTDTNFVASVGSGEKGEITISLGRVEKDRNHCMEEMSDSYGCTRGIWRSTVALWIFAQLVL